MPIYEYRCKNCGLAFDKFRNLSQSDSDVRCPVCESDQTERQFSTFSSGCCNSGGDSGGGGRSRFR